MSHKIVYEKWTFPSDKIREGNLYLATSLLSSSLEVNTLRATVECADPSILDFQRNTQLLYYAQPDRPMVFRVQSILRVAPTLYELSCTSTLGLLTEGQHMGGIYTGQTALEVIADICGTVPFIVKTNLVSTKLYGWLPVASPRDNLSQVLFAIGAALKTDLDGVLRIAGLWDGVSGTTPQDRMYTDAKVEYGAKITQVVLTEHQYFEGQEEKKLFEGTAQEGDVITFNAPMHSLSATGITIQASGANWALVSAGSGTLTGKEYVHNTRLITRDVQSANTPNVKTVDKATLISLVNSAATADRLVSLYKCTETINSSVIYQGENTGNIMSTYHPFDKTEVNSCLQSADITLSNTLKAQEKRLVGFEPTKIEEIITYEYREVLTGNGEWTVPEGVENVIAVLIGGGGRGGNGEKGGSSRTGGLSGSYKSDERLWTPADDVGPVTRSASTSLAGSQGATGGTGGIAGLAGKVLVSEVDVSHQSVIAFSCGIASDTAGEPGSETTFLNLSSEVGTVRPTGFVDPTTGDIFAIPGKPGGKGGSGGGAGQAGEPGGASSGGKGYAGENLTEKVSGSGVIFNIHMGSATTYMSGNATYSYGGAGGGGGGGRSDKTFGFIGGAPYGKRANFISNYAQGAWLKAQLTLGNPPRGGNGGKGADGSDGISYGSGGNGGGGGGGGGACSSSSATATATFSNYPEIEASMGRTVGASVSISAVMSNGGDGGTGGAGAQGCVILYYGIKHKKQSGQFIDKNGKRFLDKISRKFVV